MSDTKTEAPAPAKKGGKKKLIIGAAALLVLVGGGVGAGVYAAQSGLVGGKHEAAEKPAKDEPHLVPKSEQKRPGEGGEGGEGGGHGGGGEGEAEAKTGAEGMPTPEGHGGDRYASTYYAMDKDFTSNLQDSVHFIQLGVAVSTPYDDKVVQNLKTNDIAVRSAILMALGDTTEDQVFTTAGKRQLQDRLVKAINATLQQKEGFGGVSNVYFTSFVVQ
ncbi:flagellar basal body-associated FliL family protein [Sphingomonas sp. S-NIH.Pt15_0812]|uniref:flagellar basal body-associated FliL family protein n=1 Tax=Sphingomonas sp. S-NIH.Pt15_0812 TaxID=1920129 RepID=UPI000F7ED883|nr:flagellar basal body-associated FliL family protein [Sphingomonas sp. S-NIH.Pt15_0812]RSU53086.1 flagellar basal body protein FliL [Sphingomonas sp. S-NIH.Pt15_0812]